MSEPVTQSEIEDVLSAVRKLVSENAGDEAKKAESPSEDASKLVLTPAFRVDEAAESPAQEPAAAPQSQDASEEVVAEVVEAAGDHEADVIALHSEPQVEHAQEEHAAEDNAQEAHDAEGETSEHAEDSAAQETEPQPQPGEQSAAPADDLAARIAELEAVVGAASENAQEDYEPDGSEEQTLPSEALRPEEAAAEDLMEDVAGPSDTAPEAPQPEAEASAPAAEEWEDVDIDAETEGYTPQEPEMLEAEPYEDEDDSAPEMAAAAPEPEPAPDPMPDPSADAAYVAEPEQDAAEDDDDDMIIDEDMLREIVSRIVREELQGPMGERITQNLRRLVRREIQRALTMRGVE